MSPKRGTHIHHRAAAVADDDPRRAAEDAILTGAWRNIGRDLWQPGDGPVSRAFGRWIAEGCPPTYPRREEEDRDA